MKDKDKLIADFVEGTAIPSKEERMQALINAEYNRSQPGRPRDYQSMARKTPEEFLRPQDYLENVVPCECCGERFCQTHDMHWADCDCPGPHEPITCEKPTGLQPRVMSSEPEGIHPPFPLFPERVRRTLVEVEPLPGEVELHHLSMGCSVAEPNPCSICEDKDVEEQE